MTQRGVNYSFREITRFEYEKLGGTHSRWPNPPTREKGWFAYGDYLGLVLIDIIDNDWSWVALFKDPDQGGVYCAFNCGTTFESEQLAREALEQAFKDGPDNIVPWGQR